MKYYEKLLEMGCFSRKDLIALVGTPAAAMSIIYDYQKKGYIERVRRSFYVTISLETKQPILSRYQIGANLFSDACISHHSAFEYYGYSNQVFYECYVATDSRFEDFEYDGVTYHRVERKRDTEVAQVGNVRVTSIEQTVVDSIRDFEKIAGLEEVLRCLILIPGLKEEQVLACLKRNENGFLYQKCGYIFEEFQNEFNFSEKFFSECQKNCPKTKRYLMKEKQEMVLNGKWKLYTPPTLRQLTDKGMNDYDAMG